jgi:hypothetical protein
MCSGSIGLLTPPFCLDVGRPSMALGYLAVGSGVCLVPRVAGRSVRGPVASWEEMPLGHLRSNFQRRSVAYFH